MIRALPDSARAIQDSEPGTIFETCWTSRMPLVAAARTGKVHLVSRESYPLTLCGRKVGMPRLRFIPNTNEERCTACAKKAPAAEATT